MRTKLEPVIGGSPGACSPFAFLDHAAFGVGPSCPDFVTEGDVLVDEEGAHFGACGAVDAGEVVDGGEVVVLWYDVLVVLQTVGLILQCGL